MNSQQGIHVVYAEGHGICPDCGSGLWPGDKLCEHKIARAEARADAKKAADARAKTGKQEAE